MSLTISLLFLGGLSSLDQQYLNNSIDLYEGSTFLMRAILALATLGLSWFLMNRTATDKFTFFSSDESTGATRLASYPMANESRWRATTRSIRWQSRQEGSRTLLGLVVLAFCVPLLHSAFDWRVGELGGVIILAWMIASLTTGIATFEPENRGRTHRFLAHHGVRPWWIWLIKLRIWLVPLSFFSAYLLLYGLLLTGWSRDLQAGAASPWSLLLSVGGRPLSILSQFYRPILASVMAGLITFSIGQLLAMVIPRGITAWLCSLLLLVPCVGFPLALYMGWMLSSWLLLLIPLLFLGASLAWSRDWLEGRRGLRAWTKLAALVVVPWACMFTLYTIDRAMGVRDIGPRPTSSALIATVIPPEANAAVVYRAAYQALITTPYISDAAGLGMMMGPAKDPFDSEVQSEADKKIAKAEEARRFTEGVALKSEVRGLIRKATSMPLAQFRRVTPPFYDATQEHEMMVRLRGLIEDELKSHLERKDLDAAWEDVGILFRMAGQIGQTTPGLFESFSSAQAHAVACQAALDWTLFPGQTTKRILAAVDELGNLPAPPSALLALETNAAAYELFMALPKKEFRAIISESGHFGNPAQQNFLSNLALPFLTVSWERERARRITRLMSEANLADVSVEPYRRSGEVAWSIPYWTYGATANPSTPVRPDREELAWAIQSTPLIGLLRSPVKEVVAQCDLELNRRRMLTMAMAIQVWRLGHDGALPASLSPLVPEVLPELPIDPFSGAPFRVVMFNGAEAEQTRIPETSDQAQGQPTWEILPSKYPPPGRFLEPFSYDDRKLLQPLEPGDPLIIGFGPDRIWNEGTMNATAGRAEDIILVLPRTIGTQPSKPDEAAKP